MSDLTWFHFLRPYWLLALVPLGVLVIQFARRRASAGNWTQVVDQRLLPHLIHEEHRQRPLWPAALIAIVGAASIVALAGPVWKQLPQPVFRAQSALIIALDLSRSMDAQDIKPNRLVRARHKVIDILKQRREGQTALIVYAQDAFVVSPLTQDTNTIAALINTLSTDLMPHQGSHVENALYKADDLFKQAGTYSGTILVVTDGVDSTNHDAVESALKQVVDSGHSVSVLGIGTKEGAPIVDQRGGFIKDELGAIVISKLDTPALQELAELGGGRFQLLTADDTDINRLKLTPDDNTVKNAAASNNTLNIHTDLWREEGPWLLLFILPLVALVFRKGWLALVILFVLPYPHAGYALDWNGLWASPDQRAQRAFNQGQNETAEALFENNEWKAAAAYRAGHYDKTIEQLENTNTADALYNKANALVKTGKLTDAVQYYEKALSLAPDHADAKYNRDLVMKYLQDQKQNNQGASDKSKDDAAKNQNDAQQPQDGENADGQSEQEQTGKQAQGTQRQNAQNGQDASSDKDQTSDRQSDNEPGAQAQQQQDKRQTSQPDASPSDKQADSQSVQAREKQQENQNKSDSATIADDQNRQPDQQQVATDQWLRRIPDDPGGLLRRKFQYQSNLNRNSSTTEAKPW